jgi:hypothetical protein
MLCTVRPVEINLFLHTEVHCFGVVKSETIG